jgi:hypothetical protein
LWLARLHLSGLIAAHTRRIRFGCGGVSR